MNPKVKQIQNEISVIHNEAERISKEINSKCQELEKLKQEDTPEEDVQSCPRRTGELGPWNHEEKLDRWEKRDADYRQCSFCGGMHPDDAIELIKKGAVVDTTTKSYKRYLCGPLIKNGQAKVYTLHFSQAQIDAWNAAVKK